MDSSEYVDFEYADADCISTQLKYITALLSIISLLMGGFLARGLILDIVSLFSPKYNRLALVRNSTDPWYLLRLGDVKSGHNFVWFDCPGSGERVHFEGDYTVKVLSDNHISESFVNCLPQ